MDATADAEGVAYSYRNLGNDTYVPEATYYFHLGSEKIRGHTLFSRPKARNKEGLEETREQWAPSHPIVWFDSKYPANSTIEHTFPLKKAIEAAILIALALYFFALRLFLRRRRIEGTFFY